MTLAAWVALLSAWLVAVASPGPDFLAVLRTSASSGRRHGLLVGAGVVSGIAGWAMLALTGLSVVFAQYETAYLVVRYLGAAFLIGYGLHIAWSARRATTPTSSGDESLRNADGQTTTWRSYRLGLMTNLANPKALVFFGALLASLVPHAASFATQAEVFTAIVATGMAWFATVAWIASAPKVALAYKRAARRIDALVGTVFAGLGIGLAAHA